MTAKLSPAVEVEIDRPRRLVFDFAALRAIDTALPKLGIQGLSVLRHDFWKHHSAQTMELLLWGGLVSEDPELTLDDLRGKLKGLEPAALMDATLKAWGFGQVQPKCEQCQAPLVSPEDHEALYCSQCGASVPTTASPGAEPPPSDGSSSGPSPASTSDSATPNSGS